MAEHALKRPSSVSRQPGCALTLCGPADPSGSKQEVVGGASGAPRQECSFSIPGRREEGSNQHVHHSRMDEQTVHIMSQRASELPQARYSEGKS